MAKMKNLFVCIFCMGLCVVPSSCDDDDVVPSPAVEEEPSDSTENKAPVSLSYSFVCDGDLVRFVTPEIIYTDSKGEHHITLDENRWSPVDYALCYYTENGTMHYGTIELEKDGTVPEPWVIEEIYSSFRWVQAVGLDKAGITNHFVVRYNRKSDYVIDNEYVYRLYRRLHCESGTSFFSNHLCVYTPTSIDMTGKTMWRGDEVEAYIDEICAKNDTVSMQIDELGEISLVSKK